MFIATHCGDFSWNIRKLYNYIKSWNNFTCVLSTLFIFKKKKKYWPWTTDGIFPPGNFGQRSLAGRDLSNNQRTNPLHLIMYICMYVSFLVYCIYVLFIVLCLCFHNAIQFKLQIDTFSERCFSQRSEAKWTVRTWIL